MQLKKRIHAAPPDHYSLGYSMLSYLRNEKGAERKKFNELMENKSLIEDELQKGALKARRIAQTVLEKVRTKIGY